MKITDVKYMTNVNPFKISLTKKYANIDIKKNRQTIKLRDKMGIINSNFVNPLTTPNRYRLIKNINANNKGKIIL